MKDNIIEIITKYKSISNIEKTFRNKYNNLYKEILLKTDSLFPSKFHERLYIIVNDIKVLPTCPVCNKKTRFRNYYKEENSLWSAF